MVNYKKLNIGNKSYFRFIYLEDLLSQKTSDVFVRCFSTES